MRITGVRRCVACGSPFDSSNKETTLCRYCENALERMNGYVVPVVHGKWIRKLIGKYTGVDEVCCSVCGCFIGVVASDTAFIEAIEGMNYCGNCGAKMDLK